LKVNISSNISKKENFDLLLQLFSLKMTLENSIGILKK